MELAHPGDLIEVFGCVRLDPHIRMKARQFTSTRELGIAGGRYKPWRDRVTQAVAAVPAADQRLSLKQPTLGLITHPLGRMPIHEALAGDQTKPAGLRLPHQSVDRYRVRTAKSQRRGHSLSLQLIEKKSAAS